MDSIDIFHYTKESKQRGVEGFYLSSLSLILFGGIWLYLTYWQDNNSLPYTIFGWFLVVFFSIMYAWSYMLFRNKGKWDIRITPSEIMWLAPERIGEKSFHLRHDEIAKIVCESSKFTETDDDDYYLVLKNKDIIVLKPCQSGVNINIFIQKLNTLGIKYELHTSNE